MRSSDLPQSNNEIVECEHHLAGRDCCAIDVLGKSQMPSGVAPAVFPSTKATCGSVDVVQPDEESKIPAYNSVQFTSRLRGIAATQATNVDQNKKFKAVAHELTQKVMPAITQQAPHLYPSWPSNMCAGLLERQSTTTRDGVLNATSYSEDERYISDGAYQLQLPIHIEFDRRRYRLQDDKLGIMLAKAESSSEGPVVSEQVFSDQEMQQIRALHRDWFPVQYGADFFEDVQYGRVASIVARDRASARIVGMVVLRYDLSKRRDMPTELLPFRQRVIGGVDKALAGCLNATDVADLFLYIATIGVIHAARGTGLATALIQRLLFEFDDCWGVDAAVPESGDSCAPGLSGGLSIPRCLFEIDGSRPSGECPGDPDGESAVSTRFVLPAHDDLELRQNRKYGIYLHVIDFNVPAQRLYQKLGFTYHGKIDNFYWLGGRFHSAHMFVYRLRSPAPSTQQQKRQKQHAF